jgi:hypothetical protein
MGINFGAGKKCRDTQHNPRFPNIADEFFRIEPARIVSWAWKVGPPVGTSASTRGDVHQSPADGGERFLCRSSGQACESCSAVAMAASVTVIIPIKVSRIRAPAPPKTARRPRASPIRPPAAAPRGRLPQATSR